MSDYSFSDGSFGMLTMARQGVRSERGFTLLELIIVCALIGIMLSLAIPSFRMTFFTDPLKSTARNLIGLVNGVRELAVRQQQPYLVHISESEKRIWYEKEVNTDALEVNTDVLENDDYRGKELQIPETVKIAGLSIGDEDSSQDDQAAIWISKQGYIQRTSIRIEDDDGNHLVVQFYPFLDAATVDE